MGNMTVGNDTQTTSTTSTTTEATTTTPEQKIFYFIVDPTTITITPHANVAGMFLSLTANMYFQDKLKGSINMKLQDNEPTRSNKIPHNTVSTA